MKIKKKKKWGPGISYLEVMQKVSLVQQEKGNPALCWLHCEMLVSQLWLLSAQSKGCLKAHVLMLQYTITKIREMFQAC